MTLGCHVVPVVFLAPKLGKLFTAPTTAPITIVTVSIITFLYTRSPFVTTPLWKAVSPAQPVHTALVQILLQFFNIAMKCAHGIR